MEKSQKQPPRPQYAKISSLLFLRDQDKIHRQRMKKQSRMIRRRKYLREHIYDNTNIFQMSLSKFNRKAAQNIIWQKNYKLKMAINILREESSSVKARLWNIEKENRKMDKQIETWNLEKIFNSSKNKPYIDMITVSKVFADQDYEIVSTKIDIAKYERILQQKQEQIERLTKKTKESNKFLSHLNHTLSQDKVQFLTWLKKQSIQNDKLNQFGQRVKALSAEMNNKVVSKSNKIEIIKKNIELKKKANFEYQGQLQAIDKQVNGFKKVNEDEIDKIKQQMRRIKLDEQNNIKDFKKDVKNLKKETVNYQCLIQQEMGEYIKEKIKLNKQINDVLTMIQSQLGDTQHYWKQIRPEIEKLQ